jgi:Arm DNA-binding domain
MKLTLTRIAALKCPPGKKDRLVFDDEQRGLGVRVTSSGGKTFLAQYTSGGRKHRIPLGSCDALSLAKAREAVRSIMGDLAKGIDPADARRRKADGNVFTVAALLLDWQSALCQRGRESRAQRLRALSRSSRHGDLDRATIIKILDAIARTGRVATASRTIAYGKACYGWAVKRGTLTVNPFVIGARDAAGSRPIR